MYVHPTGFEFDDENRPNIIKNFNAVRDDPAFHQQLYDRDQAFTPDTELKMRSGISPVSKNVQNIRFQKKPEFDL